LKEEKMPYELQHEIKQVLDGRFPRIKGNVAQGMFRSAYEIGRMAGESPEEAHASGVAATRKHHPSFTPVENPPVETRPIGSSGFDRNASDLRDAMHANRATTRRVPGQPRMPRPSS
jgi:hypothetical protein